MWRKKRSISRHVASPPLRWVSSFRHPENRDKRRGWRTSPRYPSPGNRQLTGNNRAKIESSRLEGSLPLPSGKGTSWLSTESAAYAPKGADKRLRGVLSCNAAAKMATRIELCPSPNLSQLRHYCHQPIMPLLRFVPHIPVTRTATIRMASSGTSSVSLGSRCSIYNSSNSG